MLKKHMVLFAPDANTDSASSTGSNDDKGAASSTAENTNKGGDAESIASIVKEVFDNSSSQEDNEGDVPVKDTTQDEVQKEVVEEKEETQTPEKEEKVVDDSTLPFHNHPRFKEVIQERKQYEEKVKELEPLVQRQQYHESFLQQYNITQEEFANAMNILALQKQDPAKARELLKPTWESLQAFDENALPTEVETEIQALRQQVEDGTMTADAAKKFEQTLKENAKLRQQQKIGQQRGQLTAEQQLRQQQHSMMHALNQWDLTTRTNNPDFKPKSDPNGPDGLYEIVTAKLSWMMTQKTPTTPQEAIQMSEKALNEVKQLFKSRLAPTTAKKPLLTSMNSSGKTTKNAESIRDVVRQQAAAHGISWSQD